MRKLIGVLTIAIITNVIYCPILFGSDFESIGSILDKYSNEIITLKDLDAEVRTYYTESEKGENPGVVRGDLNGDGVEDVAILTKDNLCVFLCKKVCKEYKKIWGGASNGITYIAPVAPGQIIEETGSITDSPKVFKVKLRNTSVRLVTYGKASVVYYWNNKECDFESLTTGD